MFQTIIVASITSYITCLAIKKNIFDADTILSMPEKIKTYVSKKFNNKDIKSEINNQEK